MKEQVRADLRVADNVVHAVWRNFNATEPTYVLRDLIVIELEKARAAEREACAKIIDDNAEGNMAGGSRRVLVPRTYGNLAGTAYATAIRARSE